MNNNLENEENFNIFQYVKENYIGLGLFVFAFFIIYLVDYINHLNVLIYSIPSPVPGLNLNLNSKISLPKKKLRKR